MGQFWLIDRITFEFATISIIYRRNLLENATFKEVLNINAT